jgi:hypothetical protein
MRNRIAQSDLEIVLNRQNVVRYSSSTYSTPSSINFWRSP